VSTRFWSGYGYTVHEGKGTRLEIDSGRACGRPPTRTNAQISWARGCMEIGARFACQVDQAENRLGGDPSLPLH
jgi:hypothetical protein